MGYCIRPGWWTVEEAAWALDAGYGGRIMLESAPELTFGVLSPSFKGGERSIATKYHCVIEQSPNYVKDNICPKVDAHRGN